MKNKKKIRLGIILNSYIIPAWQYKLLNQLHYSDYAEIVLTLVKPPLKITEKSIGYSLLKKLERIDRFIFSGKNDYDRKKDLTEIFRKVPVISVSKYRDINAAEIIERLKNYKTDIILNFSNHNLDRNFRSIPRYGILEYSINNNENFIMGFWEVLTKKAVSCSLLIISRPGFFKREVVFSSFESTCPYSIQINRNRLFWRSSLFIPRFVKGLYNFGESFLINSLRSHQQLNAEPEMQNNRISLKLSLFYLLNYTKSLFSLVSRKLLYTDAFRWKLLFQIEKGSEKIPVRNKEYRKLTPPSDRFWADPFVVANGENYYVFVEEFIYKKNKAHLSLLRIDKNGNLLANDKILEKPYHLSYPFIFRKNGNYYMIPESSRNRTIELYTCVSFPDKWEFSRNLMENISAVDTTLFYYNDKYWLFTTIDQTENISGGSTELFLFYSNDIFTDNWISHPANPIVSDIRNARPAGNLFIRDEQIIRPSQDCSERYGKCFNFNKVIQMDEREYREEKYLVVDPFGDENLKGIHTFNFDKDFTVVDVYKFRKRLSF